MLVSAQFLRHFLKQVLATLQALDWSLHKFTRGF